jgi:hypothetical protein
LRFLNGHGAPLQEATRQLLDRLFRPILGFSLDERETARTPGLAIQCDFYASNLDALIDEGIPEVLLRNTIRKVADEKTRTHGRDFLRLDFFLGSCVELMKRPGR